MKDELRTILESTSKEELENYLAELADNDRNIKLDLLDRFATEDCKVSTNTFVQMIEDLEDDYDMGKKWLSGKGSAGFSARAVKILENATEIFLEQDEPEELITFMLWMITESDGFTMQTWEKNPLEPLQFIADKISCSIGKAMATLSIEEREDQAGRMYQWLQDAQLHQEFLYYLIPEFIYRNTDDEDILHGLLDLLNRLKDSEKTNIRATYICSNVEHRYRILRIIGYTPEECLGALPDAMHYIQTMETIANLLLEDREWKLAYNILFSLYSYEAKDYYVPYQIEDQIHMAARNAGMEKHLGAFLLNKYRKSSFLIRNQLTKLEELLGKDSVIEHLPELLENKSTETKLKFLKEYGLMNEFSEALIEGGLMEDLVEYHDDIAALGTEKLKEAYRKVTIRSIDVKKSRDNYYDVLQTLRRLPLIRDAKDEQLKDSILFELQETYPKRKALLEAIYFTYHIDMPSFE